jgi:ankyrin repeat protein
MFLNRGPEIEVKTTDNVTALHCAASNGHLEVAKPLLDRGAEIEAKGTDDRTALRFASEYGHEAVVQLLTEKRTDVKSPTAMDGRRCLQQQRMAMRQRWSCCLTREQA